MSPNIQMQRTWQKRHAPCVRKARAALSCRCAERWAAALVQMCMEQITLAMLQAVDDPVWSDNPPGFCYDTTLKRIVLIRKALEDVLAIEFNFYPTVQDITYVAELTASVSTKAANFICIQFSYFGELWTIVSIPDWYVLPSPRHNTIIATVCSYGFRYVSDDLLDTDYTGTHRDFQRGTWRNRFFGTWDEL